MPQHNSGLNADRPAAEVRRSESLDDLQAQIRGYEEWQRERPPSLNWDRVLSASALVRPALLVMITKPWRS